MTQFAKSSLFSLLTIGLSLPLAAQEHDLRIQATKGTTVWLKQHMVMSQTMEIAGQEMETAQDKTTVLQFTVKDVEADGTLVVETNVARIYGSMQMPMGMGDVEYDSAEAAADKDDEAGGGFMPSPGQMGKMQTMLAGKKFLAKVKANGKVASLEGVAELLKKPAGGRGGMPQAELSEDTLRHMVESAFGSVPEKPAAVGATWDHRVEEGQGMPAAAIKVTLAKVDSDAYEISSTGTIEPPKPSKDAADERAAMLESLKIANSKFTGTGRMSRTDGFVLAVKHMVEMDASMESPMGGEMSMKVKSTNTIERTTAEAAAPKKAAAPADAPK